MIKKNILSKLSHTKHIAIFNLVILLVTLNTTQAMYDSSKQIEQGPFLLLFFKTLNSIFSNYVNKELQSSRKSCLNILNYNVFIKKWYKCKLFFIFCRIAPVSTFFVIILKEESDYSFLFYPLYSRNSKKKMTITKMLIFFYKQQSYFSQIVSKKAKIKK